MTRKRIFLQGLALLILAWGCTRNSIEFGDTPQSSYTQVVYVDTIAVNLSTVIADSFSTSGASSFLLGRYRDPYLGLVSTRPFFQMTIPAAVPAIESSAQFDSLVFIFRLNKYYYGDTTRSLTVSVHELAQSIQFTYNNKLYNTSRVAVKSAPLGSRLLRLSPNSSDSIAIRLSDSKGQELFVKLRQQAAELSTGDNFHNYFKGISLSTAGSDTGAVYGLSFSSGAMVMRVFYHATVPYPEPKTIDFTSEANNYAFSQLLSDRSGTLLPAGTGFSETPAYKTNNQAYLQSGAGVYLKINFPSLRSLLNTGKTVKLIKAELLIRPAQLSFDAYRYKLPQKIYLATTDQTNAIGSLVADSTGSNTLYASPVVDELYGENNYYRLNITSYINDLLTTSGNDGRGFFVIESAADASINRLIMNNSLKGNQRSQLRLHLLIINQ